MTKITANVTLDDRVFDIVQSVKMVCFMAAQDVEDVALGSRGEEYL